VQYKGIVEVPTGGPVVFSVGIYAPSAPYRGEADLRNKGTRGLVH
jgi:hypothetical protein